VKLPKRGKERKQTWPMQKKARKKEDDLKQTREKNDPKRGEAFE